MPASRKRNKGKERKAKQAVKKQEIVHSLWRGWVIGDPHQGQIINCNHSCSLQEVLSNSHPVANFMDAYFVNWLYKQMESLNEILIDLFQSHRGVFNSDNYRNMAIRCLIRIGTNMVLKNFSTSSAMAVAKVVKVLEQYKGTDDITSWF